MAPPEPTGQPSRRTESAPLLDPGFLGRLERLQLATRRPLSGRLSGEHRSRRYGTSLDFADYRQYHPGDDFRRIDYHLLARLDVLALKLFEADDDLHVRLLVDTSQSMASGGKLDQAKRIAAALGFVALVRRDSVAVHTLSSSAMSHVAGSAPRFSGRNAANALFQHLDRLQPSGTTPFVPTVSTLLARPGPPGLTIVMSDLLTPEWDAAISRLPARGGDVLIVHVLDTEELEPTAAGDLDLIDSETGARVAVSLSEDTREQYRQIVSRWLDDVALRCRSVDAGYVLITADEDIEPIMLSAWRQEGLLR